jgi:hypothetical protein
LQFQQGLALICVRNNDRPICYVAKRKAKK